MKTRRVLSLLLSLSLAVSLAAPALAAETPALPGPEAMEETGPALAELYDPLDLDYARQYGLDHPEEYAAFDPDAWYDREWADYYDSKEEYMASMGLTSQEEFRADMWTEYVTGTDEYWETRELARIEAYRSAHPGELEALTEEALLASQGYVERTPMEAFMEDNGLDTPEEASRVLVGRYIGGREMVEYNHATALEYRESDPESWESFDPDAYFAEDFSRNYYGFGDDKETYMAYNFLLTQEEFKENMYVAYMDWASYGDDNDWNDWTYRDPADPILVVNGWERPEAGLTTDGGVSYLPAGELGAILGSDLSGEEPVAIRETALAAGWDVVWNQTRNQIVLLDRERLLTGVILPDGEWMEEDLSGLNRLAEKARAVNQMKPGQSYETTGTVDVTYTALNSLDGDETHTAQLRVETLTRDKAVQTSLSMDLADLLALVPETLLKEMRTALPATAWDLKNLLNGVKVDLIWNGETGMLYVNAPIIALWDPTPEADGDAWYAFDLHELLEAGAETFDLSQTLYQDLMEKSGNGWAGARDAYSDFINEKALFHIFFGPHAITEKNGVLTWKLDEEMVSAAVDTLMGSMGRSEDWDGKSLFKECRLELTVDDKGNTSLDLAIRPDMEGISAVLSDGGYGYYGFLSAALLGAMDFRYAANGQSTAKGGTSTVELHWKNRCKLEAKSAFQRREVRQAPRTTPPQGAEIIEV